MMWREAIAAAAWTAVFGLLLGMPLAARAQEPSAPLQISCAFPSEAEKAVCRPDARRLCLTEIPKGIAVLYCLKDNRAQLSRGCAELLAGCGQ